MPKPTSKSRQELRSRFVRNAIPTEADFADLIAASLNQADDGVLKLPDQPLGLVRQKPDQPVLRFFADPAAEGSVWQVQLGSGDKPGFGLAAADGKLALFVDGKTGNVGIGTDSLAAKLHIAHANQDPNGGALILGPTSQSNLRLGYNLSYSWIQTHGSMPLAINSIGNNVGIGTTTPGFKLDVNGTVRLGGFTSEEKEEWPNIVWCRDLDKGWDEGLIKHGKSYGFFGRAGFGVHIHESRSFELLSTGWRPLLGVEGGTGNTSIRGNVKVNGCITPSAGVSESSGLLFPKDPGGGSGDAAWLRYYPYSGEACVLEIGIANDPDDYIYLKSSGGVKIDVLRLGDKWRLSAAGDFHTNDDWMRMTNIANTGYNGGIAAAKFWTVQGQYLQSDLRSKSNIKNLSSPLESILNLQGVSFTWKDNLVTFVDKDSESLGLIAQDVEKVFPQLVQSGPDGKLGINYIGLIPVLVECIKDQQAQIHSLRDELVNHL